MNTSETLPPILIAGLGRSGTTWLGKIFDSHPRVLYRNEPDRERKLRELPSVAWPDDVSKYRNAVLEFVRAIPSMRGMNTAGITPVFRKQYESAAEFQFRRLLTLASRTLAVALPKLPVPTFLTPARVASMRLAWKSVSCLRWIGLLKSAIPDLQVVLVVRHPCGMIASRLRGEKKGDFKSITAQRWQRKQLAAICERLTIPGLEATPEAFGTLTAVEQQAVRWAIDNQKALSEVEGKPGCTVLRYEDLCDAPAEVTKRLFGFCGLEWNAHTEQFLEKSTSHHGKRYYGLIKDPRRAANAWRDELPCAEQERIIELVRDTTAGQLYFQQPVLQQQAD